MSKIIALATTTRVIVVLALLSMTGRVTMLNISRWTGQGGSYRTVQRFFNTVKRFAGRFFALIFDRFQKRENPLMVYLVSFPHCSAKRSPVCRPCLVDVNRRRS